MSASFGGGPRKGMRAHFWHGLVESLGPVSFAFYLFHLTRRPHRVLRPWSQDFHPESLLSYKFCVWLLASDGEVCIVQGNAQDGYGNRSSA